MSSTFSTYVFEAIFFNDFMIHAISNTYIQAALSLLLAPSYFSLYKCYFLSSKSVPKPS